ncbi:MAG TPA: hypothetical protein VLS94_08720 [Fusibacter sp.]|nr:hypothetical protein [Fusibacter sp.]
MIESVQVIQKLIERYDYGGALEVLKEKGMEKTDTGVLINSCRYAKNFDFTTAESISGTCPKKGLNIKHARAWHRIWTRSSMVIQMRSCQNSLKI